jgi:hypothetical protein
MTQRKPRRGSCYAANPEPRAILEGFVNRFTKRAPRGNGGEVARSRRRFSDRAPLRTRPILVGRAGRTCDVERVIADLVGKFAAPCFAHAPRLGTPDPPISIPKDHGTSGCTAMMRLHYSKGATAAPAPAHARRAASPHHTRNSRIRYCTASATCSAAMRSAPSRSAIVRATRRM